MAVYLDCNATTPIEPRILEEVVRFMSEEFGNAGSRTHEYGARAKQAVQRAREKVAEVVQAEREEVLFTSGATESNNLALIGLADYGQETRRRHIISTMIEHKAVLEPLELLSKQGFEITLVPPTGGGWVEPEEIRRALREDTLLVSVMHVNNETGIIQPIPDIIEVLAEHPAYFHIDAAQSFGKLFTPLQSRRIDLISISGHKVYAPKGIGALIARRRGFNRPPLKPLFFGGGQERGLRPGTLPVPLIVGLGIASELALLEGGRRAKACEEFRHAALNALASLEPLFNGDPQRAISHVINFSLRGIDSEALMVALKEEIAVSNGSACTSHSYQPSHVLKAMEISDQMIHGAVRLSWCHLTEQPNWNRVVKIINSMRN